MLHQITLGPSSSPPLFMHLLTVTLFRWRRIIALRLGRRGSRPPEQSMAFTPPHIPVSFCSRYHLPFLIYLSFCVCFSAHFVSKSTRSYNLSTANLPYSIMATFPDSHSTQLTAEEALVHDFDHVSIHPEPQTQSYCLVVKILSSKPLKVDWIQKAMSEAWVARCPFTFSEYHSGLFLVQFGCEGDRRRVMEGQPWHFDRSLMIFAIPDGFDTILPSQLRYIPLWVQVHHIPFGSRSYGLAQFVADTIGDLIEVHLISLYDSVTPFMRVRVLLDTTKSLHRGMNVHFRKLSLTKWLKFLYEGIQNYCYHCGKLDHTFNKCGKFLHHCDHHPFPPSLSYKDVLRAPAKSIYKKSIFELSTSIPFEEQPTLSNTAHPTLQDHSEHFAIPTMAVPSPSTVITHPLTPLSVPTMATTPSVASPNTASSPSPPLHAPVHCPLLVQPFTNATTNPSINKGKAPMYPNTTIPLVSSPPISSLRIHDTPNAPDSTRKRSFARQQCQVVPREGLGGGLLLFWKDDIAVNILSHSLNHIDSLAGLITTIVSSLSSFPGVKVHHISRSLNTTAHNLARHALGTNEESTWNLISSSY
ncbi:hypothetical protein F8388_008584 [Cannabis sativa]|uniref:DUF4283 domain-containing protein n=1 Tax=Cannabis sativa TaxID=3483 RepID=A0A7J6FLS3_CANSA|nr:hypothetical protein F8388_008584 [Cannabis sativa]KAF4403794.1 hypothetical protein G4B88_002647 [Cannabis sativa]